MTTEIEQQRIERRNRELDEEISLHRQRMIARGYSDDPQGESHGTESNTESVEKNMSPNHQTKKKVPILTTATAVMAQGTMLLTGGDTLTGGLLMLIGVGLISAYEMYQMKELPTPVDDEMISDAAETIADRLHKKMNK